ncbi:MAG: IS1 family transposase [Planctomycetota bacterium]|nr:IS1 family transposase [Planctomycetota bacterium]
MNKLPRDKQERVIAALVEGNSIRSTVRMTGVAKNTVVKLLVDLGNACAAYHDKHVRDVNARRVQVDEIWSFVGCKQKTKLTGGRGEGDVWTWTAIEAETKLVLSYLVGLRDIGYATEFMRDVAGRIRNRVQLTSDGHKPYLEAVEDAFGGNIDYAMLKKIYGPDGGHENVRYSPPVCIAARATPITGNPDPAHISTSYSERQNLTMRMSMRRFTRLTNAFSKKIENHAAAVALHFMYYNFCRIHQTLRITPAMAAGLSKTVWEISDLLNILEADISN